METLQADTLTLYPDVPVTYSKSYTPLSSRNIILTCKARIFVTKTVKQQTEMWRDTGYTQYVQVYLILGCIPVKKLPFSCFVCG